jgi:hypothetical protein
MIKNIWSILCKQSIIDRETNNLSILDVLEEIKVNINSEKNQKIENINIPINYEFVSLWRRDTASSVEKFNLQLSISDPQKKIIKTFDQEITLQPGITSHRSIFRISGFLATISGEYLFKIKVLEEPKIEYQEIPLKISIIASNPNQQ